MEEILGTELWNLIVTFNPILAGAIVALTGAIKTWWKDSPRWATIAVGVVLTAVYYFIKDGATYVQLVGPFLASVFAYDFIVQPTKKELKDPPIGGGGGGPHQPS